jgi:hypothetical protein
LEVFNNFGGDDVGIGEVCAVFERFIFEPENVEVQFVALRSEFTNEREEL